MGPAAEHVHRNSRRRRHKPATFSKAVTEGAGPPSMGPAAEHVHRNSHRRRHKPASFSKAVTGARACPQWARPFPSDAEAALSTPQAIRGGAAYSSRPASGPAKGRQEKHANRLEKASGRRYLLPEAFFAAFIPAPPCIFLRSRRRPGPASPPQTARSRPYRRRRPAWDPPAGGPGSSGR